MSKNVPNVVSFRSVVSGSRRRNEARPSGRNLKIILEYDGTNYCGWQIQSRAKSPKPSIQETIEKTLRRILQEKIKLIGSGRTDAGVHALAQVANFKTNSNITLDKLQRALNGILPDDIKVRQIEETNLDFHSRFAAKSKVYCYIILNSAYPSAFLKDKVYFYPYPLDIKLMRKESQCLVGKHNFKSFCASGGGAKNMVRTIKQISIKQLRYLLEILPLIAIDIEADGFLYNMVRNIVGTLIEVGRGKFPKGSLKRILKARDRKVSGLTVPACGLYLIEVKY